LLQFLDKQLLLLPRCCVCDEKKTAYMENLVAINSGFSGKVK
jgi:hypothetical protein